MKAYLNNTFTIILFLLLTTISCRSTKRLAKNQALVTKLTLKGIDKTFAEQAQSYVSLDIRPNSPFNLWVYNTFNKKGNKELGEEPHILDSSLVEASRNQIEKYMDTKGYLNNKVKSQIKVKNKRAEIIYTAEQGPEFKFKDLSFNIADSVIKNLYLSNRESFTKIKNGARYDEDSLSFERENIYLLMKENGYFDFVRPFVRVDIDTNFNNSQASVNLSILNPEDGQHEIYKINKTFIRIQPSSGILPTQRPDSVVIDSQYTFYDYSGFFKPQVISKYLFFRKDDVYNIDKADLTTQRLFDLNVFKSMKLDFVKTKDSTNRLTGLIDILPLKRKTNRIDGEFTFNNSLTGVNLGLTYQNRNTFGGAEIFEIKVRGGIQFDRRLSGNLGDRLLSRDYQVGASLSFPRLISPFPIPFIGKNGIPRTRVGASYQIYRLTNVYDRRTVSSVLSYDWVETKYKTHSLTPINLQYALGIIEPSVAQDLSNRGGSFFLQTLRSQLVSSSLYSYTLNLAKLNSLSNFLFFLGSIEVGGNSAALLGKAIGKKNDLSQTEIFGVPYSQFVKAEVDNRYYKSLGGSKQLVLRINPGIGIAYGNLKQLPFDKQFFGGGSSGIRAWQARTLGPGNYNRSSLPSDSTRVNLRNIDQLGDIKFEGNLEYRFKVLDNFFGTTVKGATFLDFGNIWKLRGETALPNSQFKVDKIWNQTAIGTGVGLRFDVNFFVFRLDAGFKLKDPQFLNSSDQWITQYWFNKTARNNFKNTYSLTNNPDRYSITQIQFGIGMPF